MRLATNAVVRWPSLWPLFRPVVRWQFDRLAPVWAGMLMPDTTAPYEAGLDRVDGPLRKALDVGTGTGSGASEIARRFPDAEIVGVDVSRAMLQEARRLAPQVRFREPRS